MKTDLFTELITDRHSWEKCIKSGLAFIHLIHYIYKKNNIKLGEISSTPETSNAVFRIGDTIIKIFYPSEIRLTDAGEYTTELKAMEFCKNAGVYTPNVICTGTVYDKLYSFPYIVMTYINGIESDKAISGYNHSEKVEYALKLKEISDKIHVPTSIDIPRYDDPNKIDHALWKNMPESFREDRMLYISNTEFPEPVFVHGDFGGRNIIIDKKNRLHLLDFAESLIAPVQFFDLPIQGRDPIILKTYFGEYENDEFYHRVTLSYLLNWFGAVGIEWLAKEMGIDFNSIISVNLLKKLIIKSFNHK